MGGGQQSWVMSPIPPKRSPAVAVAEGGGWAVPAGGIPAGQEAPLLLAVVGDVPDLPLEAPDEMHQRRRRATAMPHTEPGKNDPRGVESAERPECVSHIDAVAVTLRWDRLVFRHSKRNRPEKIRECVCVRNPS